ncbi:hypothetical protein Esti_004381 [Eimeria stiedai]
MSGNKKAAGGAPRGSGAHEEERREKELAQGVPAVLQRLFNDADRYLNDSPLAQKAASYTGLRPSVLVAGVALFMFISLGTGLGGGLVCDVAGFLYPAWMSFRAIETPGTEDDKLWLTYWVVYGAFSLVEYFVDFILFWVPFYYLLKFCFLLYLALPCFKARRGAESVYNIIIRPLLLEHQQPIDAYVDSLGEAGTKAAENIQSAVQGGFNLMRRLVSGAGSEAAEKLLHAQQGGAKGYGEARDKGGDEDILSEQVSAADS